MLWPVRSETHTDDELLNAAGVAAFTGVIDALTARYLGSIATTDFTLINVHGVLPPRAATTTRPARPEIPAMYYDVTAVRLRTALSFLRSRKAGVGS